MNKIPGSTTGLFDALRFFEPVSVGVDIPSFSCRLVEEPQEVASKTSAVVSSRGDSSAILAFDSTDDLEKNDVIFPETVVFTFTVGELIVRY